MVRRWQAVACRIVGAVRRRPLLFLVLWFVASVLPGPLADLALIGGPVLLGVAWATAGGARHRRQVEAVASHWSRARGAEYRRGWFGLRGPARGSL